MMEMLQRLDGAQTVVVIAILAGALVFLVLIVAGFWYSAAAARHQADLKREMLTRGLPVAEIERLCLSPAERAHLVEVEHNAREVQTMLDLKRDMVARGLGMTEIARLTEEGEAGVKQAAAVLADSICRMAVDGRLDRNAVAGLIELFLRKGEGGRLAGSGMPEGGKGLAQRKETDVLTAG